MAIQYPAKNKSLLISTSKASVKQSPLLPQQHFCNRTDTNKMMSLEGGG